MHRKTKVLLKEIEYSTTLKFFQNEEIISYYENNLKFLGTDEGKSFVEAINKSEVEALENIKVNFSGLGESNIGNDFFKQISGRTNVHEIKDIISDYKTEVNALNELLENKGDEAIDFIKNRGFDSIEILKVYGLYKDGKVSYNKVELGRRMGTEYELKSGVPDNSQVVVAGQSRLVNGMEVEVEASSQLSSK